MEFTEYNGKKMAVLDDDGRYSCVHSFVEETDYEWFSSTDGEKVVVPFDEVGGPRYPMVLCSTEDGGIKGCIGKQQCGRYSRFAWVKSDYYPEDDDLDDDLEECRWRPAVKPFTGWRT